MMRVLRCELLLLCRLSLQVLHITCRRVLHLDTLHRAAVLYRRSCVLLLWIAVASVAGEVWACH